MPNVMLTYRCNLKCSYCFANKYVNNSENDISLENFRRALDFLTTSDNHSIGLIGGEPTLHKNAGLLFEEIVENKKVSKSTLYTNGVELDKYENVLATPKFHILFNCNSSIDIGKDKFDKLNNNIELMLKKHFMKQRVILGINLYSNELNYDFILNMLKEYKFHRLRISLTVPNSNEHINSMDDINARKEYLFEFLHKLDDIGVVPFYDCNKPPFCIWNSSEKEWITNYVNKYGIKESNLITDHAYCIPVIDILPNLVAIRCFGMSNQNAVSIDDFRSLDDLIQYFYINIDERAHQICKYKKCENCYEKRIGKCMSGCMSFIKKDLEKFNTIYPSF